MRSVLFRYFCHGISYLSPPRRDPIVRELLQVGPFDGPCQRRLAPPSAPCAPRSSVLAPFTDPMRPCRRPDRLSRRLEREESPEAMLTRRLRRGRRGAVALLLSHAHTPELEASTPSPKCACLTGTDPSAGLRRGRRRRSGPKLGRRSRDTIGLIARKSRTPPARSTPGSPCCVCPARRDAWLACAKPRPRKPHVAREHTTPHKKIDHHHQRSGPPGRHNCPEASAWARAHVKGTQRRSNATAVKTTWPAKALC